MYDPVVFLADSQPSVSPGTDGLGNAELPIRLHSVLVSLAVNSAYLPDEALVPDANGQTFISQWIEKRHKKFLVISASFRLFFS